MTEEDSYVTTLMTSLELIRSGVTSFAEPGGQFVSGMARALEAMLLATAVAVGVYTGLKMAAMMGGIAL